MTQFQIWKPLEEYIGLGAFGPEGLEPKYHPFIHTGIYCPKVFPSIALVTHLLQYYARVSTNSEIFC
jgi:hypothetical protein